MDQQGQGYLYQGPPVPASFQPPMVSSGPTYEAQQYDAGPLFYGATSAAQYNNNNGVHHHHHHHLHGSFYHPSFDQGYGGNYYFVDGVMVPGKSKLVAGPESFHHHQQHQHHFVNASEPVVSFPVPPQYVPPFQLSYQPFHVGTSSSAEPPALLWNQGPQPGVPFVHAPVETGNSSMGIVPSRQQHHETIRSSLSLRHAGQRHHQTHLVAPPVPRHSNGSSSSNSSVAAAARVNHRSLPPPHLEMGHRHAGAPPATGIRIYRPHRGSDQSSAPRNHHSNHQHLAQLRYLQADEVAILEIPDYYEIGEYNNDHHSDLRLDIEDMSYEELLALGERIGNVNTGLTEETITGLLKTVSYLSPRINLNLELEPDCSDTEPHCCIICQDNYKDMEKVGVLDCGHEYHAECLTKWLVIKNVCPVCKCEGLSMKTGRR